MAWLTLRQTVSNKNEKVCLTALNLGASRRPDITPRHFYRRHQYLLYSAPRVTFWSGQGRRWWWRWNPQRAVVSITQTGSAVEIYRQEPKQFFFTLLCLHWQTSQKKNRAPVSLMWCHSKPEKSLPFYYWQRKVRVSVYLIRERKKADYTRYCCCPADNLWAEAVKQRPLKTRGTGGFYVIYVL